MRAVLALSPYSQPFAAPKMLAGLAAPVRYQSGTRDYGVNPALHRAAGSYDQSPMAKYYVELDTAGHFAWTDIGLASAWPLIVAYRVAFPDHYVKGEPADGRLTKATPGVASLRYSSELGDR